MIVLRPGEIQAAAREHRDRKQRQQRQQGEGCDKACVVDHHAGQQRSAESRNRVSQREQAEVLCPLRRGTETSGRVLRRKLKKHERHTQERRRREERGNSGTETGKRNPDDEPARAQQHRATHADPIGEPAGTDGEEHRQKRIQAHQRSYNQRRRTLRQREQRHRDATPRQHGVVEDAKRNQRDKGM